MKLAAQAELSWTPNSEVLQSVEFDFTAVMPDKYTYPAVDDSTNAGVGIGATLELNSDRLEALAFITPVDRLELEALGRIGRHGNGSTGIPGGVNWIGRQRGPLPVEIFP